MARLKREFSPETKIDEAKVDFPPEIKVDREKIQAESNNRKKKYYKIRLHGSNTIHGVRYSGIQTWAEDDKRLKCAISDSDILEVFEL